MLKTLNIYGKLANLIHKNKTLIHLLLSLIIIIFYVTLIQS